MLHQGLQEIYIATELMAEIKSAGHNYFKIKKAINKAIKQYKHKNLNDQAESLNAYFKKNLKTLGWVGWVFLSKSDHADIISKLNQKIRYFELSEKIARRASPEKKNPDGMDGLYQFYQKTLDYIDSPIHLAMTDVARHKSIEECELYLMPPKAKPKDSDATRLLVYEEKGKLFYFFNGKKHEVLGLKKEDHAQLLSLFKNNALYQNKNMLDLSVPLTAKQRQALETLMEITAKKGHVRKRNIVMYAVKEVDQRRHIEDIYHNLNRLIEYLERIKKEPRELEALEALFKKINGEPKPGGAKAMTFEAFVNKLIDEAKKAKKASHYRELIVKMFGLQAYLLDFYKKLLTYSKDFTADSAMALLDPFYLRLVPEASLETITVEADTKDNPKKATTTSARLHEELKKIAKGHLKKTQAFDLILLKSPDELKDLKQIGTHKKTDLFADRYCLVMDKGTWKLFVPNDSATDLIEKPLHYFPGLKSILATTTPDNFFGKKDKIKDIILEYSTLSNQIKKIENLGVLIIPSYDENKSLAVHADKFYLVKPQKKDGQPEPPWKLYMPNKDLTGFIELELDLFPGLTALLKKTTLQNIGEMRNDIEGLLLKYLPSIHLDVDSKIDFHLFNFVNNYINETPPDYLKIYMAASLAQNRARHDDSVFNQLCQSILTEFPHFRNPAFIAEAIEKDKAYDAIIVDFNSILVARLDEIEEGFKLTPDEELDSATAKDKLSKASSELEDIAKEIKDERSAFEAIKDRSDLKDLDVLLQDAEQLTQIILKSETHLEDLVTLRREIQLNASMSSVPLDKQKESIENLKTLNQLIVQLEGILKVYHAHANVLNPKKEQRLTKLGEELDKALEKLEDDVKKFNAIRTKKPYDEVNALREQIIKNQQNIKGLRDKLIKYKMPVPFQSSAESFKPKPPVTPINLESDEAKILEFIHQYSAKLASVITRTHPHHEYNEKDFLDWLLTNMLILEGNETTKKISIKPKFEFDLEKIVLAVIFAKSQMPTSRPKKTFGFFSKPDPVKERYQLAEDMYQFLKSKVPGEMIEDYQKKYDNFIKNSKDMTIDGFVQYCRTGKETRPYSPSASQR